MRVLYVLAFLCSSCFELKGVHSHYPMNNTGEAVDISVLTFNILSTLDLGAIQKGYPTWWARRKAVFRTIEDADADLVTIQECSPTQFEEFRDRFSERYFVFHKAALTPDAIILVKRDRFTILEKGFWGLENPIDTFIRRVAVWAKLRENGSGRELMFVGTHLDAHPKKKTEIHRIKSELSHEQKSGAPLILAGDFNITSETDYYPPLVADGWKDSYLGDFKNEVKTFPLKNPSRRIDHVFYFGTDIESVHWERLNNEGKEISDHFPVLVKFHIKKASE